VNGYPGSLDGRALFLLPRAIGLTLGGVCGLGGLGGLGLEG